MSELPLIGKSDKCIGTALHFFSILEPVSQLLAPIDSKKYFNFHLMKLSQYIRFGVDFVHGTYPSYNVIVLVPYSKERIWSTFLQ